MAKATEGNKEDGDGDGFNPVLARNFRARLQGRAVGKLRLEMAEAGFHVGTGAIDGMKKGATGIRLETLEKFARFFGCSLVDLLTEEAAEKPAIGWPFPRVDRSLYDTLSPDDKIDAQGGLRRILIDLQERNLVLGGTSSESGDRGRSGTHN